VHLRALLFYAAPLNDARKTIAGNCFGVFISLKAPGLYSDGGNLGLQVMPGGSRSWIFQYDRAGKRVKLGLGPLHTISARHKLARPRSDRIVVEFRALKSAISGSTGLGGKIMAVSFVAKLRP
jgi:hypothetical protein